MPSRLTLAPGLAMAGLTTTVSLAAAMGGVQALTPAASRAPQVATVALASAASGSGTARPATTPVNHPTIGSASSPTATTFVTATTATSAQPSCVPSQLPARANGVGNRCVAGPPGTVPGKGQPGAGTRAHGSPSPHGQANGLGNGQVNGHATNAEGRGVTTKSTPATAAASPSHAATTH